MPISLLWLQNHPILFKRPPRTGPIWFKITEQQLLRANYLASMYQDHCASGGGTDITYNHQIMQNFDLDCQNAATNTPISMSGYVVCPNWDNAVILSNCVFFTQLEGSSGTIYMG